ncbi:MULTISPECIES: alpha/beta fold hydrolase [unclassified Streptomyces]|uniref:alpha/beta fold hydrolase n=1 Tax=unclassified Streptomyces TaxID=2593676 RepID=UPI0038049D1A
MISSFDLRPFASSDGELAYVDAGEGDLVVLLHPGFADHRAFAAQIPALARNHRVVVPDTRGFGFSANAREPFRWPDDLAALLRHLDAGPAALVGVSMGGAIATDTALEHPELVRGVLVSGASTSEFTYTNPWHLAIQEEFGRTLAAGDIEGWLTAFLRAAAGEHRTVDALGPDAQDLLRTMALHTLSKHTPDEENVHVPVTDTWSRVPGIDVPVLTVNGTLDAPELIEEGARLARTVRDGRSVTIEGVGHHPHLERPEEFTALVTEFLRDLGTGPAQHRLRSTRT